MKIVSRSVKETMKIGRMLARKLLPADIICLYGNLGSGKTVLTKGIAEGLGIKAQAVVSPTFVLIRQYEAKIPLYHFDLYRLESQEDIEGLGYEEYLFDNAITVIEWADRLGCLTPKEYLRIELSSKSAAERKIEIRAIGERYKKLLSAISRQPSAFSG
jgi:tRNA threonylcarbamoyladenosine biosynthesis protein TsaE